MLRFIRGGAMPGREDQPVTINPSSESPIMTPALTQVFVGIFRRLLTVERSRARAPETGRAA